MVIRTNCLRSLQAYSCGACLVHYVYLMVKCALVTSLSVWCMYGVPCVFHGKMCACEELIHLVRHVWLTSLLVWYMSSVP